MVAGAISQLGLEYPLLKGTRLKHETVGLTLILEIILTIFTLPLVIYVMTSIYYEPISIIWLGVSLLFFYSISFVSRFALLGLSNSRGVLLADSIGVAAKFIIGYALVMLGYGAVGLIASFVMQSVLVFTITAWLSGFNFRVRPKLQPLKDIIREGVVNAPAKLSRMFIVSLSIVLLASLGVSGSNIGIFYIALMISIVAGSLSSSIAYMLLPVAGQSSTDLSVIGSRVGISLTAILVTVLLSAPKEILSIIGPHYSPAADSLFILSIGILPSAITLIAISRFNSLNNFRRIIIIGVVQVAIFLATFYILVPNLGILGAAWSITLSFAISAVPAVVWLGKVIGKFALNATIAVVVGTVVGYILSHLGGFYYIEQLIIAIFITILCLFALRNTSTKEIMQITRRVIRRQA
jgi:O-antigen/teichoic acid export membrane protein